MKKLKGFTLTEIIIALAISSLVVLSGLSIYYITFKNSMNFYKNADKKIQLLHLLSSLQNDVEHCRLAIANGNKLSLVFLENRNDYFFYDSMVVINTPIISDTIELGIYNLEFNLDDKQVNAGIVNEILISIKQNKIITDVFLKKKYDAVSYLK